MTVGVMLEHTIRFKELKSLNVNNIDIRLANMMTDLEGAYQIPMLRNEIFN